jgi:hypothetical protein
MVGPSVEVVEAAAAAGAVQNSIVLLTTVAGTHPPVGNFPSNVLVSPNRQAAAWLLPPLAEIVSIGKSEPVTVMFVAAPDAGPYIGVRDITSDVE